MYLINKKMGHCDIQTKFLHTLLLFPWQYENVTTLNLIIIYPVKSIASKVFNLFTLIFKIDQNIEG